MRLNKISLATSLVLLSSMAFADPSPKPKVNLTKAKNVKSIPMNAKVKKSIPALRSAKKVTKGRKSNEAPLPPITGQNGLIAKVNGQGIKLAEFTAKYDRFTQTFKARKRPIPRKIDARYRDSIVKRLVEEALIAQEASNSKVKVNPKELQAEFEKYKAMFKTQERFNSYLQNAKLTEAGIKENLSKNLKLRATPRPDVRK